MKASYPELETDFERILRTAVNEEEAFLRTLNSGLLVLDEEIAKAKSSKADSLTGDSVFLLHDTYGFPVDLTFEIALDEGAFGPIQDMPQALKGQEIEFQFESPIQAASKRANAQVFQQSAQLLAIAAQIDPNAVHDFDVRTAFRQALDGTGAPAEWIVPKEYADQLVAQAQEEQAMQAEIEQALGSIGAAGQAGEVPVGAVLVRGGEIIAAGFNRPIGSNDPTAHAEVVAIRRACTALGRFDLRGAVLYTSCEPCPMCLAAAYWARVDAVVFGNARDEAAAIGFDDQWLYDEVPKPLEARSLPMRRLLGAEALEVFTAWAKKPDKVRY
jgi:tRNA(Arg) A34 adenosine deaminase TadA